MIITIWLGTEYQKVIQWEIFQIELTLEGIELYVILRKRFLGQKVKKKLRLYCIISTLKKEILHEHRWLKSNGV